MIKLFNRFHPLERFKRQQHHYIGRNNVPDALRCLVTPVNFEVNQPAQSLDYVVLDIETTGLNPETDRILSFGWVVISNNQIDLASAEHCYVEDHQTIKAESAVINHITPQMLTNGISVEQALHKLLSVACGKVLVAHGCMIEKRFINEFFKRHHTIYPIPLIWIDTLAIEKALAKALNDRDVCDFSLSATRERYNLPEYIAHNALVDSLACAELLLAQQKRIDANGVEFGHLFRLSH